MRLFCSSCGRLFNGGRFGLGNQSKEDEDEKAEVNEASNPVTEHGYVDNLEDSSTSDRKYE